MGGSKRSLMLLCHQLLFVEFMSASTNISNCLFPASLFLSQRSICHFPPFWFSAKSWQGGRTSYLPECLRLLASSEALSFAPCRYASLLLQRISSPNTWS